MSCVSFNNVSLTYGIQQILGAASFSLPAGSKVGLVGENGSGKSTILKLICREISPDCGAVETTRGLTISHVRQLPEPGEYPNAVGAVLAGHPQDAKIHARLVALEPRSDAAAQLCYADLVMQYSTIGGYELEDEARRFLVGLGLSDNQLALPIDRLSGGERSRIALAAGLLTDPQLLLLDEPDSHLDIAGLEWLQDRLRMYHGTLLLVSHDRELLEGCTDAVLELEDGTLRFEQGSLNAYFRRKQQRLDRQAAEYMEQQRRVARLKRDIRKTEDRARSFDNRSTNDHWRRIGKKIARTAVARKQRLERELGDANRIDKPTDREHINLKLQSAGYRKHTLLVAGGLSKSFGDLILFDGLDLELHRGQRIALTGTNGCGKTSLLESLLGIQAVDRGEVWLPRSASVFYCDQHHAGLDPRHSACEALESGTALNENQIHYALSQIGLKNYNANKLVSVLSGGERTRLLLALLANSHSDLLVLDEPTGHLDLPSIGILEQVLSDFTGAVLFVSHDRRFISAVATDVLLLEQGRIARS